MSGTTTSYSSSLPPYAEPYWKQAMEWAGSIANPNNPYPVYPGQRIADFNSQQWDAFAKTDNLDEGYMPYLDAAGQGAGALGSFGRSVMDGNLYTPTDYENKAFTTEQINSAMSPFLDTVLDRAQDRAVDRFNEQQVGRDQAAARTAAFGGSRRYVADAMAERDLNNTLSDLEATQLSGAFDRAQGFLGQQRQLGEASRQFGVGTALKGADIVGMGANLNSNLATTRQRADLSTIDALLKTGGARQGQQQKSFDLGYNDFLAQRDYPLMNLQNYSAILRGMPVQASGTSTTTPGTPSMANQIGGGALTLAGLFGR